MATSNRRKSAVPQAVLRSMVSPLPMMVRFSPLFEEMTGSPLAPLVVLSTADKTYGEEIGAVSVMVFVPPAFLVGVAAADPGHVHRRRLSCHNPDDIG